jgi:2-dehydropantoate 2-reductase
MRVLIIGAGSIGLLFGSYLSQIQGNVTYITRSKDQSTFIKTEGVRFYPNEGEPLCFTSEAYSIDELEQLSEQHLQLLEIDFVLVTVKQTQLDEALPLLKEIVPMNKPLLFMMNGLGHVEKARKHLPQHSLYFGITQNGAARISPNAVEERGRGMTKIGHYQYLNPHSPDTEENLFLPLIERCNQFGIRMSWSEEIEIELIRKCIVNACINPLTALFNVKNGHLLTEPRLHQWMHQLYVEIETLIKKTRAKDADKILLNGELWQEIETICRNTSQNHSSMVQDIQHGRKTEIEAINGYFLDQARKNDSKLSNHKFLYEAIYILQKNLTKR